MQHSLNHSLNRNSFTILINNLCLFYQLVVYLLDRLVWMLLVTAFTTQALQMAGIIETPKGYQAITYSKVSILIKIIHT